MTTRPSPLLFVLFRFLLPPTIIALIYLYFYQVLTGCAFPTAKPAETSCILSGSEQPDRPAEKAPFRLLALADPQLEGDTSLPDQSLPNLDKIWKSLKTGDFSGVGASVEDVVKRDFSRLLQGYRKRLDLWGNDMYLAHVFASVRWWTQPTHIVVLGDLLGSQWIGDEEFERRADRFWRVFKGTTSITPESVGRISGHSAELSNGVGTWKNKIIAVAGNHDIGYAGDLDRKRIERFERRFGQVNWETRLRLQEHTAQELPSIFQTSLPELRLVILNSMNLDEPAYKPDIRAESLDFLDRSLVNSPLEQNNKTATILLTHIPLHKEAGICIDGPYFSYFLPNEGGGIREQNHLSKDISQKMLDGLAKYGDAVILNGHDHEGCDTYHYMSKSESSPAEDAEPRWEAEHSRFSRPLVVNPDVQGVREITVRSMMGSYGGNAGLLSAWFDEDEGRWRFEYDTCVFGVQHIWWGINVLILVELGLGIGGLAARACETRNGVKRAKKIKKT